MTVEDLLSKIENGSAHILIWSRETGEVFLKTIWYNEIDRRYLSAEVLSLEIRNYEMRIGVK